MNPWETNRHTALQRQTHQDKKRHHHLSGKHVTIP